MGFNSSKRNVSSFFYNNTKNWRRVAHIISDKIYERLTGEEWLF